MSDCMTFPDTVEEFMDSYKVVDTEGIYMSKGTELVPIFRMNQWFEHLPPAQPEHNQNTHAEQTKTDKLGVKAGETYTDTISRQAACEHCHEDSDGYVAPLEKNCHAFIRFGMNGWELDMKANGWRGSAKIKYCPMCGRSLTHE